MWQGSWEPVRGLSQDPAYISHCRGLNWPCSRRVAPLLYRVWPFVNHHILIRFPGSQGWTSALRLLLLRTFTIRQSHKDWRRKYKISLESYCLSYSYSIGKGRKITVQDLAQSLFMSEVLVGHIGNYKKVTWRQKKKNLKGTKGDKIICQTPKKSPVLSPCQDIWNWSSWGRQKKSSKITSWDHPLTWKHGTRFKLPCCFQTTAISTCSKELPLFVW